MKKLGGKTGKIFLCKFQKTLVCLFLVFLSLLPALCQDLPDKIRGYKVYKEKIVIQDKTSSRLKNKEMDVEVKLDDPKLSEISVFGITLELGGKVTIFGQSGTVDFISFKDFEVNGVSVEIKEYSKKIDFKKNNPFRLEKPIEMFISAKQTLRAAMKEVKDSKDEWLVTGRIFVFGRFKKMGFNFKRVVPVEVRIKIPNPLKAKIEVV